MKKKQIQINNEQNKVIVITGAGSGLGRELARRFYKEGFYVCLLGRNKRKLLETVEGLDDKRSLCLPCDIKNYQEVKKAFRKIKTNCKRIDILINNAGIFEMLPIDKTSPKIWDNILKTNAYGTFYCTKEAVNLMRKSKAGGRIINILSIITEKDLPFNSAYAASKYAVKGMMDSLKEELAGENIHIMNISPGRIDTGIWNKRNKTKSQSPKEVAEIIYCLSAQNTTYANNISLLPLN